MVKAVSALLLASLVLGSARPAATAEDKKVYPGVTCQPSSGSDSQVDRSQFGQLINRSTATREYFCPIVQDSLGPRNDLELAEVRLFQTSPANPPSCRLRIVNINGSPGFPIEASDRTTQGTTLILSFGSGAPNVPIPDDSMLLFACTLPPQSAIASYSVTENINEP